MGYFCRGCLLLPKRKVERSIFQNFSFWNSALLPQFFLKVRDRHLNNKIKNDTRAVFLYRIFPNSIHDQKLVLLKIFTKFYKIRWGRWINGNFVFLILPIPFRFVLVNGTPTGHPFRNYKKHKTGDPSVTNHLWFCDCNNT